MVICMFYTWEHWTVFITLFNLIKIQIRILTPFCSGDLFDKPIKYTITTSEILPTLNSIGRNSSQSLQSHLHVGSHFAYTKQFHIDAGTILHMVWYILMEKNAFELTHMLHKGHQKVNRNRILSDPLCDEVRTKILFKPDCKIEWLQCSLCYIKPFSVASQHIVM